MPVDIALSWDHIKSKLRNGGIFRTTKHDYLIWRNSDGVESINVRDIYRLLISDSRQQSISSFPSIFWKTGCQSKMVFFSWLTFHNKNLTWENLKKRGWLGPGLCPLCSSAEEDNSHLFLLCKESRHIWLLLEKFYGFQFDPPSSIMDAFIWCSKQIVSWRSIFIITLWCLWRWRNDFIFKNKRSPLLDIFFNICALYEDIPLPSPMIKESQDIKSQKMPSSLRRAFFDGAEQNGICGCGFHIVTDEDSSFSIHWNGEEVQT